MNWNDWIGTIGVGLILTGYFANTFNLISGKSRLFFVLNSIGAVLACYASLRIDYWPFVILEGAWAVVWINKNIRTMNVYFVSGLGVDKRVFKKLILPDGYSIHYIE